MFVMRSRGLGSNHEPRITAEWFWVWINHGKVLLLLFLLFILFFSLLVFEFLGL